MSKLLTPVLLACLSAAAAPPGPVVFPVPQEMKLTGVSFALRDPVRIVVPETASDHDWLLARELAADLGDRHSVNVSIERTVRLPVSERFVLMGPLTNPLVKQYCAEHG